MAPAPPVRSPVIAPCCLMLAVTLLTAFAAPLFAEEPLSAEQVQEMLAGGESLAGMDFSQAKLAGVEFKQISLDSTKWIEADLRGAEFLDVDLRSAEIINTNARGVSFCGCDLSGAVLRDSDLSGASLKNLLLWGTVLENVRLAGVHFEGLRLSPSGATHLAALAAALRMVTARAAEDGVTSHPLTAPEFVAGLTGDAFAFAYDPQNPGAWPGQPFVRNPLVAAGEVLGCQVQTNFRLSQAAAFKKLRLALDGGGVCLLPLRMPLPGSTGSGLQEPLWAAATELTTSDDGQVLCRVIVPPFGEMQLLAAELNARWQGAQITLQPVTAAAAEVQYPLIAISPPTKRLSLQQTALWAIANAIDILTATNADSGTTLYPGLEGIQKLTEDLSAAAAANDGMRLVKLSEWEGLPRLSFLGSRQAAADFLNRISVTFPHAQEDLLAESAVLLRSGAAMLESQWQPFAEGEPGGLPTKEAVQEDIQVLAEVHAVEQQVLTNLNRILQGTD